MAYEELKASGITDKTPKEILLGAGTIHKNFKLKDGAWNFDESIIGATSGGNHLTIQRETMNVEPDGAMVKVKGLEFKTGETATLEVNLLEINKENVKLLTGAKEVSSTEYTGYDELISKSQIETGDYLENFAFVGKRTDGTPIIVIFENALCTSGIDIDAKNKENATFPATFECYANVSDSPDKLPWHILIAKETSSTSDT